MTFKVTRTDILAAKVKDEPGGLAMTLKALADYGADLDCVVGRRRSDKKGEGVVFVSATNANKLYETPDQAGFHGVDRIPTLKIEGPNRPGMGAELTKVIGDAQISMRGLTVTTIGHKFCCFIGFDGVKDLETAQVALEKHFVKHSLWHRALHKKIGIGQKAKT